MQVKISRLAQEVIFKAQFRQVPTLNFKSIIRSYSTDLKQKTSISHFHTDR